MNIPAAMFAMFYFLSLFIRRGFTGSNRPNRFVGYDCRIERLNPGRSHDSIHLFIDD